MVKVKKTYSQHIHSAHGTMRPEDYLPQDHGQAETNPESPLRNADCLLRGSNSPRTVPLRYPDPKASFSGRPFVFPPVADTGKDLARRVFGDDLQKATPAVAIDFFTV